MDVRDLGTAKRREGEADQHALSSVFVPEDGASDEGGLAEEGKGLTLLIFLNPFTSFAGSRQILSTFLISSSTASRFAFAATNLRRPSLVASSWSLTPAESRDWIESCSFASFFRREGSLWRSSGLRRRAEESEGQDRHQRRTQVEEMG
jgi:hypothetical protein